MAVWGASASPLTVRAAEAEPGGNVLWPTIVEKEKAGAPRDAGL